MFDKKDKRYNDHINNYTDRYADLFKLGIVVALVGGIVYGLYKLVEYLFL